MKRRLPLAIAASACALYASVALCSPYYIPDAELLLADFGQLPGYSSSGSTLDGRAALPQGGVAFQITLAGPDDGKMGIGDPWPTNSAAGLLWDPGEWPPGCMPHWTSLADYDSYEMWVSYLVGPAGSDIDLGLILNTGLCGPSGYPRLDPFGNPTGDVTNDTFWGGEWTHLALGQTAVLRLDFDAAEAWNISDNKAPHTGGGLGWPDGGIYAINDRDMHEISNIGIQIADFNGDALGAQIELHVNAIPEPATLALLAVGGLALLRRRRR